MDEKPKYGWNEIAGITIVMVLEKISPLLHNRKAMLAVYLAGALGVSLLIGGAVSYLVTYGSPSSGAAAMSMDALDVTEIPVTAVATVTATASVPPTPAVVMYAKPAGEWTDELCRAAGTQMNAQMASFWTSPQGVGCNILTSDGIWIHLP